MHLTIDIDPELVAKAQRYCDDSDPNTAIRTALMQFVQCEAAKKLAALGGSEPELADMQRERPDPDENHES